MWYAVTLRAKCEMVVMVEANSRAETRRKVYEGEYDDMTDWEPVHHETAVIRAEPRPNYTPPDHY